MTNIESFETVLTGNWLLDGGRMVADITAKRIATLTSSHLIQVGRDSSGWKVLYRDPDDGRLWELTYPKAELHGGGPPQLQCISIEQAKKIYGV